MCPHADNVMSQGVAPNASRDLPSKDIGQNAGTTLGETLENQLPAPKEFTCGSGPSFVVFSFC